MNERTESQWAGADVEHENTDMEQSEAGGAVREDVSSGMPSAEPRHAELSTADIAGGHGGPAERQADAGVAPMHDSAPLFPENEAQTFRGRWEKLQISFVDDPRKTVQEADALVAEVMQRLAQTFAQERERLETEWERGGDVSTEDLRVALQRYRSFFGRLLSV